MNEKLLEYFNNDELACNVWLSKYAMEGEKTPDDEIWKITGDDKHAVSNYGRIMNIGTLHKTGNRKRRGTLKPFILKNRLSANTYLITFNNNLIHRLVAKEFVPNPNNYPEVNHIDGNKLNNHYTNLEWCTSSMNQKHSYKLGLQIKNSEDSAKLTRKQVEEIRNLYSTKKYTQKELGEKFGVQQQSISKIINLIQWK